MIVQQTSVTNGIEVILRKHNKCSISVDKDKLHDMILKVEDKVSKALSNYDKININALLKYLRQLESVSKSGVLNLFWEMHDGVLKSKPLNLLYVPEYGIDTIDCILVESEHVIRVDVSDALKIIAFDFMYRDLDYSIADMESNFKSIGIISAIEANEILQYIDADILQAYRVCKCGDSPYKTFNSNTMFDYFSRKKFNTKYYREPITYSFEYMFTLLAKEMMEDLASHGIDFGLCSLSDSGMYFIIRDNTEEKAKELLSKPFLVRSFGRKFEVKPRVLIY